MEMDFTSDNSTGASALVLQAIVDANNGSAPAYGADDWTRKAEQALAATFETDLSAFLVATGTASNALALSAVTQPWGAILCHEFAHIAADECGAPEFFAGGAKLALIPGAAGKITPDALRDALALMPRGIVKQVQPMVLSLSQATECGTIYALAEIAELANIAHEAGLAVHMDGARFANALVTLGCSPADMSWRAGVDVLSLGATKNGALACEAVIFFNSSHAKDFAYRRKRGGHTLSKGRLLGAQMAAYLERGHWLKFASEANASAARLEAGLREIAGVRLPWPREANEIFAILPAPVHAALMAGGARYHPWSPRALQMHERPQSGDVFVRLVVPFSTTPAAVEGFLGIAARA